MYISIYMCTYILLCIYTYIYIYMFLYIHAKICMYIHLYKHAHKNNSAAFICRGELQGLLKLAKANKIFTKHYV